MQGATKFSNVLIKPICYVSIHAPYAGSDVILYGNKWATLELFQSTPPMQGATSRSCHSKDSTMVSIHAPYAGSDIDNDGLFVPNDVSIHAPYAGSDPSPRPSVSAHLCFNPRPLCRERHANCLPRSTEHGFQSTPPMQGATLNAINTQLRYQFQSTPPMQGATENRAYYNPVKGGFNPRPLCRERLHASWCPPCRFYVSIHAPYAGSDMIHQYR